MKKGTYFKAVVILDKESKQCLLDNCYHKTAQDAEKYLEAYEKLGGRPREEWIIQECGLYRGEKDLEYKKMEEIKYKKGKYRVPYLDACEINYWSVNISYVGSPAFTSQEFFNKNEAVSYFEEVVNYCTEHQLKYKMRLIQGCRRLLDIEG